MEDFRCPECNKQHVYAGMDGLLRLSTRLKDSKVGYRSKTENKTV